MVSGQSHNLEPTGTKEEPQMKIQERVRKRFGFLFDEPSRNEILPLEFGLPHSKERLLTKAQRSQAGLVHYFPGLGITYPLQGEHTNWSR